MNCMMSGASHKQEVSKPIPMPPQLDPLCHLSLCPAVNHGALAHQNPVLPCSFPSRVEWSLHAVSLAAPSQPPEPV